VQGFWHSKSLN
jgi:voltage-dependent potassium channel beta subunit